MRISNLFFLSICSLLLAVGPATQPSKQAAERAEKLKAHLSTFTLTLHYSGNGDKPYYQLNLGVPEMDFKMEKNAFHRHVQITEDEAKKIIDQLAAIGFFDQAFEHKGLRSPEPPKGSYYTLSVRVTEKDPPTQVALYEEFLPLGPDMFGRLDGLRKSLDGDAATDMDLLLGRLSGERKASDRAKK